ncbi:hypothetical protein JCM21142_70 [Saccharicrinis fermentans DSM 9555 = JCM 21142]|uniref:Secretion system C-terminal sorting domain-containing protein n=1 Tax=Saccharicrinis fermentans DSM 9555 = JCM 21142 TaxID=869213 RepID=W7Y1R9_9BACT|nr:hypothetical protein JCM21142_70 [Saccharicrinis fermentans DSM 9555 = JCM 21142]
MTYTLKHPIIVSGDEDLAFIKYIDIAYVETGAADATYMDEGFYDYVAVEGSKDGLEWKALAPGYDFSYNDVWNQGGDDYASTPTVAAFTEHTINLLDNFAATDTILIRFKLHSDPFENGWGWIIDNLRIQGQIAAVEENVSDDFEVTLFPNPVDGDHFNIRLRDAYVGTVQVSIYNASGQQLLKSSYFKGAEVLEEELYLPKLLSGFYLVKIEVGNRQVTKKLSLR